MKNFMLRISIALAMLCSAVTAFSVNYSGTLPVIFINTENNTPITSKENYLLGTYWLDPMGNPDFEAIGSEASPLPLQIRGRGNYSWWGFDKKPYRLKLDKKAALLGMNSSRHFALLAHADDPYGFLRNPVGFQLSRLIGMKWTPADKPVELVLNGSYEGIYFLTETIRVAKDRVNIVEQPDEATDPEVITGGWLVEIDNYDSDPHVTVREDNDNNIIFTYKTPEILSQQQEQFLYNQMNTINGKIYSADKNLCSWAEEVNLEELAKFYIVQELMDNYESFHGSCYLYRQQGQDEQWYFGPVWDFGSSLNEDKTRPIYEGRQWHNTWIEEMCKFPAFMDVVRQTWADFYNSNFNEIYPYIASYVNNIRSGAEADAKRWPQYGNADINTDMQTVVGRIRSAASYLNRVWKTETPAEGYKVDVYFRNTRSWEKVYAYLWGYPGGDLKVYTGGGWPGTEIAPVEHNGETLWHFTMTIPENETAGSYQIIFNNGSGGDDNQTADLDFINNSIYDFNGYQEPSAVAAVSDDSGFSVAVSGSSVTVTTNEPRRIEIANLAGSFRVMDVAEGQTVFSLPQGFYIIGGVKVIVR